MITGKHGQKILAGCRQKPGNSLLKVGRMWEYRRNTLKSQGREEMLVTILPDSPHRPPRDFRQVEKTI